MATISSPGIGSGLDVRSIVSQLTEIERQPLTRLQAEAASVQARISTFGEIRSLVSELSSAAGTLNSLTTWGAVEATSSRPGSVTASAIGNTAANSFSVEVQQLAHAQSFASASISGRGAIGAGTLNIQLGSFGSPPGAFSPAPTPNNQPISVTVTSGDTLVNIASKINELRGPIQATVLNDGAGERLLLRSRETGVAAGFQVTVNEDPTSPNGLSRLISNGLGNDALVTQFAQDARIRVNNSISVSSTSNTFTNVISGVTLTLANTAETGPGSLSEIRIAPNQDTIRSAIDQFVEAFNRLNSFLTEATRFDPSTRQAGLLQGDSFAVGIQNTLRGMLQSSTTGSVFERLSDVGVRGLRGGNLEVDSKRLNEALAKPDDLRNLFRGDSQNPLTDGVGLKIRRFADGLLNADGLFRTREDALRRSLDQNSREQTRVNERATRIEAALNRRYSALDAQLAGLTALNNYVAQQVTMWNNQGRNS
jgi:flagellar hook-associated protein 2